jgi:hypothetical protein
MTDPQLALAAAEKMMWMFGWVFVVAPVALWLLTRVFYGRQK